MPILPNWADAYLFDSIELLNQSSLDFPYIYVEQEQNVFTERSSERRNDKLLGEEEMGSCRSMDEGLRATILFSGRRLLCATAVQWQKDTAGLQSAMD